MKWIGGRRSDNVEDRRGSPARRTAVGGGLGVLVVAVLGMLFGFDPAQLMKLLGGGPAGRQQQQQQGPREPNPEQDKLADFVSVVLADTEDVWTKLFEKEGRRYEEPTLVLFTGSTDTACGFGESAMGPFYCPADKKVYIDLAFYDDLKKKLGAPGDFAQAYVIAHEVGHHVQNLLGHNAYVRRRQQGLSKEEQNQWSVRLELQADYYAGVWAYHADKMRDVLEEGDLEEALNAANAIGDDRLQKRSRGTVVPESFTHGTSAQRIRWFRKGYQKGTLEGGDTFSMPYRDL